MKWYKSLNNSVDMLNINLKFEYCIVILLNLIINNLHLLILQGWKRRILARCITNK